MITTKLCQWYVYGVVDAGGRNMRMGWLRGKTNRLNEVLVPGSPLFTELPTGCALTVRAIKTNDLKQSILSSARMKGFDVTAKRAAQLINQTDHIQLDIVDLKNWTTIHPEDLRKRKLGTTGKEVAKLPEMTQQATVNTQ